MTDGLPALLRKEECGQDIASNPLSLIVTTWYLIIHLIYWKYSIIKSANEKADEVPCAAWPWRVDALHPGHTSPR